MWLLASEGDDDVGGAIGIGGWHEPERVARGDVRVRRAWHGRGIANALKAAEIAWAKEAGYERLETQNEERNEPIRRLNERYGYVVTPGSITVRGLIQSR